MNPFNFSDRLDSIVSAIDENRMCDADRLVLEWHMDIAKRLDTDVVRSMRAIFTAELHDRGEEV